MIRSPNTYRIAAILGGVALVLTLLPSLALAQQPPQPAPIAQPAEFARVRARFESMTPAQARAAGFEAEPACVAAPPGGMGFHAMNRRIFESQFRSGRLEAQNPPILLFDGNGRVVGLEWEAAGTIQPAPVLFGQTIELLPGHPGVEEPHHMLHAYFKPNGQVLFATFDPALQCPPAGVVPAVLGALLPTALPRTGGGVLPGGAPPASLLGLAGALTLAGALALTAGRHLRGRRPAS